MGDLYVLQVVLELRSGDSFPVRVHNVAFEKIEPRIVAKTQIVRVPDKTCIPLKESIYSSEYLGSYGFQSCNKVRELRLVRFPQEPSHGRPRGVNRRSNDGVGDVCAEPLDVEGIVQESVAEIVWGIGNIENRIHAQDIGQHKEVQMQRMVPDHEPVICQPAKCFRLLCDRDPPCAFDRHQRSKEMRNRTRATDPGQKGWNRNDPLAPNCRCKEPPVVPDNKLQILDYFIFDDDL